MNRADVADELRKWGVEGKNFTHDLHGFVIEPRIYPQWRLKHGGGIACRSHVWWMERIHDGAALFGSEQKVTTRAGLRRLLREFSAFLSDGQKPPARIDADGYLLVPYAKLHAYAGNQSWVWIYRRSRALACCGGSDEHPPEHTQDCSVRPGGGVPKPTKSASYISGAASFPVRPENAGLIPRNRR